MIVDNHPRYLISRYAVRIKYFGLCRDGVNSPTFLKSPISFIAIVRRSMTIPGVDQPCHGHFAAADLQRQALGLIDRHCRGRAEMATHRLPRPRLLAHP